MKKILAGILAVSMIGSANLAFATDTDKITVKVNGEEIIKMSRPLWRTTEYFFLCVQFLKRSDAMCHIVWQTVHNL